MAEPGDLVGAVASVAHEDQPPVRQPQPHDPQQRAHDRGRGAVWPAPCPVVLLRAVQAHQHRQGPGPGGEAEAHQHGEHDPLVAVPPGGIAVAGADRVAVAGLAVDPPAGVSVDGIIPGQQDRSVRGQEQDHEPAEAAGQAHRGPRGGRGDPLVGGDVPVGQRCGDAEQLGDGASPGTQQGGPHQEDEPLEGRAGGRGGDGLDDWQTLGRYNHRGSSLVVTQEAGSTP